MALQQKLSDKEELPEAKEAPTPPPPLGGGPQAQAPSIGGLATEQTRGLLADPGQFGPQAYERRQEQANVGLNTALQAIPGGAAGSGIDPSSPAAKLLEQSAILGSQRMRHEAARQQDLLEEGMRREDIASGINQYLKYLNTIFNLAGRRAGTRSGGSFPQVSPINTQAPLGQGVATAGYLLGNYFQNQPQTQPTGQQPIVNAPPNVNFGVQNPFGG